MVTRAMDVIIICYIIIQSYYRIIIYIDLTIYYLATAVSYILLLSACKIEMRLKTQLL